jgi:hypothetical protein
MVRHTVKQSRFETSSTRRAQQIRLLSSFHVKTEVHKTNFRQAVVLLTPRRWIKPPSRQFIQYLLAVSRKVFQILELHAQSVGKVGYGVKGGTVALICQYWHSANTSPSTASTNTSSSAFEGLIRIKLNKLTNVWLTNTQTSCVFFYSQLLKVLVHIKGCTNAVCHRCKKRQARHYQLFTKPTK